MKNKTFEMCMLFDFYGDILTDKQKELFDRYYNDDCLSRKFPSTGNYAAGRAGRHHAGRTHPARHGGKAWSGIQIWSDTGESGKVGGYCLGSAQHEQHTVS